MMLRLLSFAAWLAVSGLLAHAAYRLGASGSAPRLARLEQDIAEARAKAGGGCERVYEAAWGEYTCGLLWKSTPDILKPALCKGYVETYRQPDLGRVRAKMDELGPWTPLLTLHEERGASEKRLSHSWKSEVK